MRDEEGTPGSPGQPPGAGAARPGGGLHQRDRPDPAEVPPDSPREWLELTDPADPLRRVRADLS